MKGRPQGVAYWQHINFSLFNICSDNIFCHMGGWIYVFDLFDILKWSSGEGSYQSEGACPALEKWSKVN